MIEQPARWLLWVEGGIGYDSNAPLATDFARATGRDDETINFSAYGHYDFTRLRFHALANMDHYFEMGDLNFDMLETGISLPREKGIWSFRPGLSLRYMQFGGEGLQDSAALLLESAAQTDSGFQFKFYVEHESIAGADSYQYLDGTRSSLQASVSTPDEQWRFGYETEFNEREDLFTLANNGRAEFFSFSPRRGQWELEYRNPLTPALDLRLAAALQNSKYNDPDIRADGRLMRRKDSRERLILELGYDHAAWRSAVELTYIERNSNFVEFDYDRSVLMLNLSRNFGG
jgi:hypothetical protein